MEHMCKCDASSEGLKINDMIHPAQLQSHILLANKGVAVTADEEKPVTQSSLTGVMEGEFCSWLFSLKIGILTKMNCQTVTVHRYRSVRQLYMVQPSTLSFTFEIYQDQDLDCNFSA